MCRCLRSFRVCVCVRVVHALTRRHSHSLLAPLAHFTVCMYRCGRRRYVLLCKAACHGKEVAVSCYPRLLLLLCGHIIFLSPLTCVRCPRVTCALKCNYFFFHFFSSTLYCGAVTSDLLVCA
ncbi:hypothetical protein, unlikely [Trypanosoma brucei gambiense DAL972]|uniref:Uncharacterized protein n=1 Tax=Trypanosoma brucei gambiense (strain MHOM/CI/86/DAL972) TaxID=679716 RepID=D0A4I6_TRYB9|nr:hypothetical protein, unlikely [Trypanosoma brucei gambiense DAL972]CBH16180.1 hypothetical protein, unlikely [Trypanosoma brucei gambiense DAL972]|eukprot:XP_011778444.1 hypothetical protein, unlikely [Trypanosoma brucei gambiense DAL972]